MAAEMIYQDPKTGHVYADTREELDAAARNAGTSFSRLVPGIVPSLSLTPLQARRLAPSCQFIDGREIPRLERRYLRRRESFRLGFALVTIAAGFLYVAGSGPA